MKKCSFSPNPMVVLLALAVGVFVAQAAAAQTTGSISGLVQDPSNASIPAAQVVAKNVATNNEWKTITNQNGTFEFPSMPPGRYQISVEAPGFKRAVTSDVVVNVTLVASVVVKMEIGAREDQVTVIGEAQQAINTVSAELQNVVERRQLLDLPLPTRDPTNLARLQAGVAVPSGTNVRSGSINGLRGNLTNLTQDGVNIQDNYARGDALFSQASATVENTGEFSVSVGTLNADSGTGAAQVKFVTPSGTNAFHGSLFEFHRNRALNANSFFGNQSGTPKQQQIQNRFGFNAGGPFYVPKIFDGRDRTFVYTAYEGYREPIQATRNRTVWSQAARNGIFQYYVGSELRQVNLLQVAPYFNTINPVTKALLDQTPPPNNGDLGDGLNTGGFRFLNNSRHPAFRFTLRVDQKLTNEALGGQHKLELVINRHKFTDNPDMYNSGDAIFPGGVYRDELYNRFIASAAIHSAIGARIYNEARFGFITAPVFWIRSAQETLPYYVTLALGTSPQYTAQYSMRNSPVYTFLDNLSYVRGTHTLKMGFEIRSTSVKEANESNIIQTVSLGSNTSNPDGLLMSMFPGLTSNTQFNNARAQYQTLVGLLNSAAVTFNVVGSSYVPGAPFYRFERYREFDPYITDQWRLRPNFTITLGLRYELVGVPDVLSKNALLPENGIASLWGVSGAGNLFQPGNTPGSAVNNLVFGSSSNGKPLYNGDHNNFGPSFGIAYQPRFSSGIGKLLFGSSRSSFRGGYSISFTREGFSTYMGVLGYNQGTQMRVTNSSLTGVITSAGVPIATPAFVMPRSDADYYNLTSGSGGYGTFDPNFRVPYVQQWSFGFERELPRGIAVEVRYAGNHAAKLPRTTDINEVNVFENGFLQEFLNAQKNLQINGGKTFAPGAAGTVALPIFSTLFAGLSASQGFASSSFIQQLNTQAVGSMAFSLANSTTFLNNRKNLTINGKPAPNFFLANPNLNFARIMSNGGDSNYNSLQMEVRRRFSSGLMLQANYTFSKAITNSEGGSDPYRTVRDISVDRHVANFDVTHTFNANWLYDLPFGKGRRFLNTGLPVIGKILEGWQFQGLLSWHTAPPFSIWSQIGTVNQFNSKNTAAPIGDAVDVIRENEGVFKTPQGIFWLDPKLLNITVSPATGLASSATLQSGLFTYNAPGDLGTMSYNLFRGPRFFQTDFSLLKRTRIREKANVEMRFEFFNVFNNANFSPQGSLNFDATNFGRLTSTFDPRIIQIAMRFNW